MATQEFVVPKSIPITSPASSDFQRRFKSRMDVGWTRDRFANLEDALRKRLLLAADNIVVKILVFTENQSMEFWKLNKKFVWIDLERFSWIKMANQRRKSQNGRHFHFFSRSIVRFLRCIFFSIHRRWTHDRQSTPSRPLFNSHQRPKAVWFVRHFSCYVIISVWQADIGNTSNVDDSSYIWGILNNLKLLW